MSEWDDVPKLIDDLRLLHAAGLSFSEIAAQLGHGLTRNACIGKAKRLGLPMRRNAYDAGSPTPAKPRPRKPRNAAPTRGYGHRRLIDRGNNFFDLQEDSYEAPRELPPDAIPLAQRKTLMELKPHHCRFIYGDPLAGDFFYCGGDNYVGSYCAYHHSVTHSGTATLTPFERARRRQFRINAHRIEAEAERLAG